MFSVIIVTLLQHMYKQLYCVAVVEVTLIKGMAFSPHDRDNDLYSSQNCAQAY